ncbi:peptidase S8/S53 domain-containing protein [Mucor lusitanicus]|uniref:Peptidase S8/S53 domain-containing protein n=1 Tax=Mucor circinelloides f. lusitanicus TaxID=29924 RepID=A0A8H4B6I7_MUCCL|nr:peptidase S8/S53 domain-containing protein [Mucor lusitanicus]
MRGSLQGKFDIKGASLHAESEDLEPKAVKNIDIGKEFKAVVGSFNPSFVNYLSQLEDVEYVETNQIYKAAILPTVSKPQPYISSQVSSKSKRNIITQMNVPSWGLARINRRNKDDMTTYSVDESAGGGVHVYVFDSGINVNHPDFGGRASMEASFIDYEDNVDYAGHGTHVAGTIGGNSYGVAKNAILHGVKILDRNGDGTTSALIQAISHITQIAHGIPIFVSAGNSGDNACDYSPSANPDVFTVGASNQNDIIPSFSSYGECVRIYAPGTNITSSWLGSESQTMDGTSMANPHVTGIAAMLMSEYEFHSASELYEAIMNIATENVLTSSMDDDGSERLLAYNGPERF